MLISVMHTVNLLWLTLLFKFEYSEPAVGHSFCSGHAREVVIWALCATEQRVFTWQLVPLSRLNLCPIRVRWHETSHTSGATRFSRGPWGINIQICVYVYIKFHIYIYIPCVHYTGVPMAQGLNLSPWDPHLACVLVAHRGLEQLPATAAASTTSRKQKCGACAITAKHRHRLLLRGFGPKCPFDAPAVLSDLEKSCRFQPSIRETLHLNGISDCGCTHYHGGPAESISLRLRTCTRRFNYPIV